MNAHRDAREGRQTPALAGVASVPTVDAAAVLAEHRPNPVEWDMGFAMWSTWSMCMACHCPWQGDAETGGCEAVLLAQRVALLDGLLRSVEWVNTADGETLYCPRCGWMEQDGHSPACPLGAALADGGAR